MVTLSESESGTHVVAYTIISRLRLRLGGHSDSESESGSESGHVPNPKVGTLSLSLSLGFFRVPNSFKKFENSVEHFRFQSVFLSQNRVFFDIIDPINKKIILVIKF
jgi:hypothetical protein